MNDRLDATMRSLCATGARILEDFSHSDVHLQLDQAGSWCFGGWHHREYMFPGGRPGTQRYIRFTEPEDNEQCVLSAIFRICARDISVPGPSWTFKHDKGSCGEAEQGL